MHETAARDYPLVGRDVQWDVTSCRLRTQLARTASSSCSPGRPGSARRGSPATSSPGREDTRILRGDRHAASRVRRELAFGCAIELLRSALAAERRGRLDDCRRRRSVQAAARARHPADAHPRRAGRAGAFPRRCGACCCSRRPQARKAGPDLRRRRPLGRRVVARGACVPRTATRGPSCSCLLLTWRPEETPADHPARQILADATHDGLGATMTCSTVSIGSRSRSSPTVAEAPAELSRPPVRGDARRPILRRRVSRLAVGRRRRLALAARRARPPRGPAERVERGGGPGRWAGPCWDGSSTPT